MSDQRHPAGTRRRYAPWLNAAALLASAAGGCSELAACPGAEPGARFRIEVLEPKQAEMSCQDAWGLGAGASIEGSIAELRGEYDCRSGFPEVDSVGDWSWTRQIEGGSFGGHTLEGRYIITNGSCSALLNFELLSDPPLACDASAGEVCDLIVRINPDPATEEACPEHCAGTFHVRAQRL
ncbi:MAG TPA: hypothetical protein VKZ49_16530 [Polyangiaceae bacterium]|nr:hypothetical protein [Polyangiaceae bacterium]